MGTSLNCTPCSITSCSLLEVEKKAKAARSPRSRDLHDESSTKLSRIARMSPETLNPGAGWKKCRHKIDLEVTISFPRVSLSPCITYEDIRDNPPSVI